MKLHIKYIVSFLLFLQAFHLQATDNLSVRDVTVNEDSISFIIENKSNHNLYLFDSYLQYFHGNSPCFFRRDNTSDKYILSFEPLLYYLAVGIANDLIRINEFRPIINGQMRYSFVTLRPDSSMRISVTTKSLRYGYYFDEFVTQTPWEELKFCLHPIIAIPKQICLKLAFYRDISFFISPHKVSNSRESIEKALKDYTIFSFDIDASPIQFRNKAVPPTIISITPLHTPSL